MTSTTTTIFDNNFVPSTAPAAAPTPATPFSAYGFRHYVFPTLPGIDIAFDIATVALIICFVLLSLLSLFFILHLKIKSRHSVKLRSFTSQWTARFLMIILVLFWAVNEFLRLPIFRKGYVFPLLPPLTLFQQAQFCKYHLLLSFGLFEPGFLVTLLFLVYISVHKRSPNNLWAIAFVGLTCLPLVVALYFGVFVFPTKIHRLMPVLYRHSVVLEDPNHPHLRVAYCTYPLLGTVIFAVFGVVYALVFLFSCWKVASLAINKRVTARVNALALSVIVCLSTQVVLSSISVFWQPDDVWYNAFVFINFASILTIGAISEGILVIKPVTDTLRVECCPFREHRRSSSDAPA